MMKTDDSIVNRAASAINSEFAKRTEDDRAQVGDCDEEGKRKRKFA